MIGLSIRFTRKFATAIENFTLIIIFLDLNPRDSLGFFTANKSWLMDKVGDLLYTCIMYYYIMV